MTLFKTIWNLIFRNDDLEPIHEILDAEKRITVWDAAYKGEPDWLDCQFVNLYGRKDTRKRKSMKPAKLVTHEMASLIWAEMPELNTDKSIEEILEDNAFWENMPAKSQRLMALGGMAIKLFVKDEQIKLDFIPAHRFIPISWDNKRITEARFIDRFTKKGKEYIRVESHSVFIGEDERAGYIIENSIYEQINGGAMVKKPIKDIAPEYQETVFVPTTEPLFVYTKNPEENNIHVDSPLGISMYANALDTIESLDIAFDALQSEIVLGRKRIIVPASAVRNTYTQDDGGETKMVRYFDPSDEVFQAFDFDEKTGLQIQDNSVELRIEELRLAVQTLLDILSVQVGFSAGYLSFDSSGVKTATEVISDNSKTFKTKKFWEGSIGDGIVQLCDSIRAIAPLYDVPVSEKDYSIAWDDSIIEDRNSKAEYWINRYNAGTTSLKAVIMALDGLPEKEAETLAASIKADNATVDIAGMFGGTE